MNSSNNPLIERCIGLGIIEPVGVMLPKSEIIRIVRLRRLRRDLGLNLVDAAMAINTAEEMSRLRAQLQAHREARTEDDRTEDGRTEENS